MAINCNKNWIEGHSLLMLSLVICTYWRLYLVLGSKESTRGVMEAPFFRASIFPLGSYDWWIGYLKSCLGLCNQNSRFHAMKGYIHFC